MPVAYPVGSTNPFAALYGGGGREKAARLPLEVREDLLTQLASRSGQTLENIGLILDTPGAIARGVLAGDPLSGFNFNYDDRVSGKELLESYGLSPGEEALGGWADDLMGFGAEVITDPLWLLQSGIGVLPKAARAAQAADILQYAPKAAMRKLGGTTKEALAAAQKTLTGKSTFDDLTRSRVPISESTLEVRPLIGPRLSRYKTTLQDALNETPAAQRPEALRQVRDFLGSDEAVNEAMGQRLGNLFGVGFGKTAADFSPFSEKTTSNILDAFDYLGQATAWSPAGRYFGSFFDERVGGRSDLAGQIDAMKAFKRADEARAVGNLLATRHGQLLRKVTLNDDAKQILGADTMMSKEGNDVLLRLTNNKPTAADEALLREVPELRGVVGNFDAYRESALDSAKSLGLALDDVSDRFGSKYTPMNFAEADPKAFGPTGAGSGSALDAAARVEYQRQRNKALSFPGGGFDTRELSLLPKVREHAKRKFDSPFTDEEVGMEIYDSILNKHGNPMVTLEQATAAGKALKAFTDARDAGGGAKILDAAWARGQQIMDAAMAKVYGSSDEADTAIAAAQKQADTIMFGANKEAELLARKSGFYDAAYQPGVAEGVNLDQTTEAGRVFRKMKSDLPGDVPAFSEHPINAQMRYMVNTSVREATARHIFESVAEHAMTGRYTQQKNETMRPLAEVVGKYSQSLGFRPATPSPAAGGGLLPDAQVTLQIQSRLAKRMKMPLMVEDGGVMRVNPKLDLNNFYIPEEVADRLVRVSDFYSVPEAQDEVGNMFSTFTSLWKSFTLGWPSTKARDAYSNLASIWLETGDAAASIAGMNAARHLMAGNSDKALGFLAKIPRYANFVDANTGKIIDSDGLLRSLELDVGGNGVLSGLATTDLLTTNREGKISQFIPGATPVSISGGLKQLLPDGTRSPIQAATDALQIKGFTNSYETRNQWLNAFQEIGDSIDSMARLGGFLALLKKGVGPQQASKRMKSALVDYSSLTPFERHWMKNIFLWWSYQSRIGKYAVESLATNPGGRYGQMIRGVNNLQRPGEGEYIPTSIRQQVGVRLPDSLQLNPTTTSYLTNIDLPGLDVLNILQPAPLGQTFPVNVQGTLKELVAQSNPITKTIGELAFDEDLYSKRPLSEAKTAVDKIYAAATGNPGDRLDPVTRAFLNNVPVINRPLAMLGTALDPDIENPLYRAGKVLMNETTGLRLKDVEKEYEYLDARNKIGEFLKRYQNTFTQRYIPEDQQQNLPPEAVLFNALDTEIQQDLTEFYKRRRAKKAFEVTK